MSTPALIHFTEGGPWFAESRHCPYSREWFEEFQNMALKGAISFQEAPMDNGKDKAYGNGSPAQSKNQHPISKPPATPHPHTTIPTKKGY